MRIAKKCAFNPVSEAAAVEPDVEPPSATRLRLMPTPFRPQQLPHKNDIHGTSQSVFSDLLLPGASYASG